ncbi:alpha-L-fucosidase [Streptomyces spiralis]|nr:alpha-L-fucosidase [Streptomyces spiralis]
MSWFTEARFGLFIHWGIYAAAGRHEWAARPHSSTEV